MTFIWDGGHAGQNNWTLNQNWNPNGAPTNDGTADLVFTGGIRLSPDANGGWSVNSITFDAYAGAFALVGDQIDLQGNAVTYAIANNSVNAASISNVLTVAGSQTWAANTADLAFSGTIALGANTLTLAGAAHTTASGAISGTGALVKTGTGTLTLTAANSYTGGTTVSAGTLVGTTASLQGNIANSGLVVFDEGSVGTFAGVISGTGALTKQNTGTVTLTNSNTFTGATTITGGTLALGTANALAGTMEVSIAAGATLQLAAASQTIGSFAGAGDINLGANTLTAGSSNASTTFSGAITGTGGLVKQGSGTLALTGANSFAGGATVDGGILQGNASSLTGNIALSNNATRVVFDQAANGTYAGAISGSGAFTKQNSGTLTLSGANTFTGATTVNGGTLALGAANALSSSTAVSIASGATLQLTGGNQAVGSFAGAGNIDLGAFTLTTGGTHASTVFSGALSGSGGLVKTGAGTLELAGANSYSGGTTVTGGTLQGTTTSLQGNIGLSNGSAVVFDQNSSGTYAGTISGAGSVSKTNTGTVTLSGLNTYAGATTISSGTLALGVNNALPSTSNVTIGAGATLDLAGRSVQVGTFSYTTAIVDFGVTAATNYLLFNGGGTGSGTLTINNFDAGTDLLAFASTSTVDAGYLGGIYFYGIGAGILGSTNQTIAGYSGTWNLIVPNSVAFRTWDGGGNANTNWSQKNNWDGNNPLVSGTSLKVEFAGTNSLTSNVDADVTLNTLRFASGATTGAFTINATPGAALTFGGSVPSIIQLATNAQTINAPLVLNSSTVVETSGAGTLTLAGAISGAGGINKVGTQTLVLAGASSFDGATTVNAGTIIVRNGSALGSTAGGTTVSAGATLQLENNVSVGAEALTLDGTLRNASGTNSYDGAVSGSGVVTIDGGSLTLGGTAANAFTGVTTVNSGMLDLAKSGGTTAISGNLAVGTGTGSATTRLLASNQILDTARVTLGAAGTPVLNLNGFSETIGSLASTNGGAAVQLGAGSLMVGGDDTSTTFAGTISGTGGSLTKQGSGTFTLSGANSYTGATAITAGTVVVQNSTALGSSTGGTSVSSGATLQLENNISIGAEALALNGSLRNASGANSFAGAISGTGKLAVDGGSLSLGGTAGNTYSGTTSVNSGTLDLNKTTGITAVAGNLVIGNGTGAATVRLLSSNQIADASAVTLASAGTPTFNLNGFSETIGSLASGNGGAAVQLGAGTLTTGGDNASTTFAGSISGAGGSLVKQGTGTFTLSGANSFTGTTTVSGGRLALGASNALSSASNLTLATGATFSLGGSFSQQLNLLSFTNATVDFGASGTANYFLLGNIGSTTGLLTIANWTNGADVFGLATNAVSQAFLDSVYFSGINVGVGAVLSSTATSVPGYGTFYTLTPIPTFTWSGAQSSGNASDLDNWSKGNNWVGGIAPGVAAVKSLIMAGSVRTTNDMDGAYQIKGLVFRSDAGAFVINSSTGDTLTVGGAGLLNESASGQTLNVSIALSANQTWNASAGNLTNGGATLLNGGYTLTVDGAFNTTINAAIDGGAGGLVKNGAGTLTLGGSNAFTGGVTLNSGVLAISSDANLGAASGAFTFAGGTLRTTAGITSARAITLTGGATFDSNGVNSTLAGAISGSGSLTKTGAGTLTLTGANSYSGGTTVNGGTLLGSTTSLQGNIANHSVVAFDQTASGTYAGVISGTGAVTKQNTGTVILTGANSYTGGTTIAAGTLQGSVTSLQGNITNNAALVFDQPTNGTFSGIISGTGALTKQGAGTLTLAAISTFTGPTTATAGTLTLGGSNRLAATSALTIGSGATFNVAGFTQTLSSLSGSGTVALGGGSLVVGYNDASMTFGGAITGAGTLEKTGTGSLAFTGAINIAGELKLNGGTVTLAGSNTISTLRISGNTTLDFGAGSNTLLSVANVIIENSAILTITNWVDLQNFFFATGSLVGFNTTTSTTTTATLDVRGVAPQNQIQFNGFAANTTVWQNFDRQITPAPEPATYGAALMAAAMGAFAYRRIRSKRSLAQRCVAER